MKQMKRITLRLSLEKSEDKAISDFLEHIDKAKYHTVNNTIKTILYSVINDTDSNSEKANSKVDMKDIITVIRTTLEIEISKLLFVSGNHAVKKQDEPSDEIVAATLDDDDIDMDFIGG